MANKKKEIVKNNEVDFKFEAGQNAKALKFKKSDISYLASSALDVLDKPVKKGQRIEATLSLFDNNGNEAKIKSSIVITGELNYKEVMRLFRIKLAAFITLKAARTNLKIKFGNNEAEHGMFSAKFFFTGKRIERYKVFNGLFILAASANEAVEVIPTDDAI